MLSKFDGILLGGFILRARSKNARRSDPLLRATSAEQGLADEHQAVTSIAMSVATVIDETAVAARTRIQNDCCIIDAGPGVLLFVDTSDDMFNPIGNVA